MGLSILARRKLREQQRQKLEARLARERRERIEAELWEAETIPAARVAELLKISRRTLQRRVASGQLQPIRLGDHDQSRLYFARADVEALLAKSVQGTALACAVEADQ